MSVVAPVTNTSNPKATIKGVNAADYYLDYKRRGSHLNLERQDQQRAETVVTWYNAMATADERSDFSDPTKDKGAQRRILKHITKLIKERLYDAFASANVTIPRSVKPDSKDPGMNWIADRLAQLKKLDPPVNIVATSQSFAAFRENARATNKRQRTS